MAASKKLGMHWIPGLKLALLLGFLSIYGRDLVWAESATPSENKSSVEAYKTSSAATVTQAIQLYREKNYVEADRLFTQLHAENPDKTKTTYYLAITKAQEGDFLEASRLYQEVIQRESGSPLGLLAQQGLKNIPLTATANVDAPPQFGTDASSSYMPNASPMGSNSLQGVSPQDLMWMQTMMGTNNNNNGNNNNSNNNDWGSWMAGMDANNNNAMSGMNGAMSLPGMTMPNAMMPGGNNMPMMNNGKPMDPQVMSSWLTNQMMQNSTMFMNDDNNKH